MAAVVSIIFRMMTLGGDLMRRERISDRFREISVGVDVSCQRGSPSRIAANESMTPSKRLPGE